MNNPAYSVIWRILQFDGMVITVKDECFLFEHKDTKFIPAGLSAVEAIEEAYLFFKAKELAENMCKNAKVVL